MTSMGKSEKQVEGCAPSQLVSARTALTEQRPPAKPYSADSEDGGTTSVSSADRTEPVPPPPSWSLRFAAQLFFILLLAVSARAVAAEWQWSVPMGEGRAFLWIPPDCARVRAVVVGQNNMLEPGILEHAAMRRTLAELGIAEIWIAPPFDNAFKFDQGAGERFEEMMHALAAESGYSELAFAPAIPLGHSACASYPWNFAAWNPARTLAILSIKGDAPQTDLTGSGKPNPDWADRSIDGIPGLMVMSEVEWWEARLTPLFKFRAAHSAVPIALLADTGHGHFDASDALVEFLALFIRHAAAARLPADAPLDQPVKLRPIDPAQGWLVDRWRGDEPLRAPAASAADYKGDHSEAFWSFDAETAHATETYYARSRGKKIQQLDFVQAGELAPISTSHAGVELKFLPREDGVTFQLTGEFIVPLPPRPPVAAKDKPPAPVVITPSAASGGTHALGAVHVSRITGPVTQVDANTFRVQFNRAASPTDKRAQDIWLLASHPGDAQYKSAVQQAVLKFPRNTQGEPQHITFPEIPDQKIGAKSLTLAATSSAGADAKVYFYVREGPAEIDGDTLRFTAIPPRAKLPIKVTVVAWQFGRATQPEIQAADPIVKTMLLSK